MSAARFDKRMLGLGYRFADGARAIKLDDVIIRCRDRKNRHANVLDCVINIQMAEHSVVPIHGDQKVFEEFARERNVVVRPNFHL